MLMDSSSSVEVFFSSVPHANRILYKDYFMSALSLPPSDPAFPQISVLHAVCAVSSLFTQAVITPPLPNLDRRPASWYLFPYMTRQNLISCIRRDIISRKKQATGDSR